MEYNNLKNIGKIYDFDGETGIIITPEKEYMFNSQNSNDPTSLNNNTLVAFYPSTVKFGNEIFNIAREIESLSKDDVKSLQKERN